MEKILENIEKIRKDRGIKQETLATLLGIKQATYSQYLNRNDGIKYSRVEEIAEKFGMSVIDIITYPEKWGPIPEEGCPECRKKDIMIQNLNEYIEILKKEK